MGLIKQPGEIAPKKTISALIYGQPGSGKTSIGCSAPFPVLFDADGGVQRINGAHRVPTVQITSWDDVAGAIAEIEELEKTHQLRCETIIVDTAGKLLDFMTAHIIKNNPKMKQGDGSLSLKGYGVRKSMFVDFIKRLSTMGKSIIFIAHEREEKRGEDTVKRPEIGGSSAGDLIKELDLVGYMQLAGRDRTISFTPQEWFYAKNTCNLEDCIKIPVTVDPATGEAVGNNNFLSLIISRFEESQKKTTEKTAAYEQLVNDIDDAVAGANTADDLNSLMAQLAKREAIYNSHLLAKQKIVARAKVLNVSYNAVEKRYVNA